LIRPEQSLRMEGSPELSLDQQILSELGDIKDGQNFMRVTLLGGVYREIQHPGMLPLMEGNLKLEISTRELLDKRVKMLEDVEENRKAERRGEMRVVGAVSALCSGIATLAVHYLTKH
jgi:hypothetical protein